MQSSEFRRIVIKNGSVQAVTSGVVWTLLSRFGWFGESDSWPRAAVKGAVVGVMFGLIDAYINSRQGRRRFTLLADLSEDERKEVVRATTRRYVPADARLRERALQLGAQIDDDLTRHRTPVAMMMAVFLAIGVISAVVDGSWWWWLGAAVFAAILAQMYIEPARLQRRLKSLAG